MELIFKVINFVKCYGKVVVMDYCDFDLMLGEILVVIGDNGVGKLILIKVLFGVVIFDEGEVFFEGKKVSFYLLNDVCNSGIEMVY